MRRRTLYLLIGLALLLIITGAAFRLVGDRTAVEPDFRATQEASLTDCAAKPVLRDNLRLYSCAGNLLSARVFLLGVGICHGNRQ